MHVDLDALRSAFGLPKSIEVGRFYEGSHGLWRIRAGGDEFGLKVLAEPVSEWRRVVIQRQARLELAAWSAGVAMPEPVAPVTKRSLGLCARVDGHLAELHRWVEALPDGRKVEPANLHPWLGRTLATLHNLVPLAVTDDPDLRVAYGVHPLSDWYGWVQQGRDQALPWVDSAGEGLRVVPRLTALAQQALADPEARRCLAHRDVNPPNVVHTADGPVLCDFGYTGPDLAWWEAVSTAVNFDAPEVLTAYLHYGGRPGPATDVALGRRLGTQLSFVAFTMWVSLGHREVSAEERLAASGRVSTLWRQLVVDTERVLADRSRFLGFVRSAGA